MYSEAKEDTAANDAKVNAYIAAPQLANEYRILKKTLTQDLYDKMKAKRTPGGASLWTCLKSGIICPDSKMGIYAADREAYDVFEEVFEPMILAYFNTKTYHPTADFGDLSKKEIRDALDLAALDTNNDMIVSTRVRVARNVDGVPYAATLTPEARCAVEDQIVKATAKFTGEELSGKYMYLKDIDEATQAQMVEDHILFHCKDEYIREAGMFGDWPNGRGAFYNAKKTLMIWVNEEDHMRIICLQKGNNLLQVYTRLNSALQSLDQQLKVATHKKWGFLASCPTNVGTGLRASVHIKIPLTSSLPFFKDLCDDMAIDIRGIHGEHSESTEGIFDISNRRRFGLTEFAAISEMARGVKNLIRIEKALQMMLEKGKAEKK